VRAPSAQSGDVCRPHEMLEGLPLLDKARTRATRLNASMNYEALSTTPRKAGAAWGFASDLPKVHFLLLPYEEGGK
jgi:hypothetical protein